MTLKNFETKYYFKLANEHSSKKLNQKCYWSILKNFLNGKEIPCIPPIFHNDNFITDIREKSELFNTFFAQQCSLIENSSTLPIYISPKTDKSLSTICFSEEVILNSNKAHGHDNVGIQMIKLYDQEICKPLHMIFVSCMEEGIFSLTGRWVMWYLPIRKMIKGVFDIEIRLIKSKFIYRIKVYLIPQLPRRK